MSTHSAHFEKVLFTRIPKSLDRLIEQKLRQRRRDNPGTAMSRSDLVRVILFDALKPKKKK